MKQVSYSLATNIRCHHTKVSHHDDLAPRMCVPLVKTKLNITSVITLNRKVHIKNVSENLPLILVTHKFNKIYIIHSSIL